MNEHKYCKKLILDLSDYIDGELPPVDCEALESHLSSCPDCTIVYDTMKKTIELYKQEPDEELPGEVKNRLYKRLSLNQSSDLAS
ncbi:MAG TPA: anti-sigma factor [Bellilinea sp.]|nr:anti-sigma factor [Bellilinea sp.]